MAGLIGQPNLAPPICTYRAYFSRLNTDTFSGDYTAVLEPYRVVPLNAADTPTPTSVSQQIYAASQQGDPIAFLLWHATPGLMVDQDPSRVSLLHSFSYYASRMGRPPSCWDDKTFANRSNVAYDTAPLAQWDPTYIHIAPAVLIPSAAAIDAAIAGEGPMEQDTRGLKAYAVARQCMSPRLMLAYCWVQTSPPSKPGNTYWEPSLTQRRRTRVDPSLTGSKPPWSDPDQMFSSRSWCPNPRPPY